MNMILFAAIHILIGLSLIIFYGKLPKPIVTFAFVLFGMSIFYFGSTFFVSSSNKVTENISSKLNEYKVDKIEDERIEGDFIYRLVTEKREYIKGESIKLYAELEYIGEGQEITIYHASSPFHFPMVEKVRNITIGYAMTQPLAKTTLIKGKPIRKEYSGSGGYSGEDKEEYIEFMKSVMDNKFPTGYFVVDGFADFYITNEQNDKQDFMIKSRIDFKVVEKYWSVIDIQIDTLSCQVELLSSRIDKVNYTVEIEIPLASKYLEA